MQLPSLTVPYVDMARETAPLLDELRHAADRVLRSGLYILGEEVTAFEAEFAAYCGAGHAVGVGNGTDALTLALRAVGVKAGDDVLTAANSFTASAACAAALGARPVFADVGEDMNLDPQRLSDAITPRTRAIVAVHLTGRPADMDGILAVADASGIPVVEDAAQAAGAIYKGRRVGTFGKAAAFSLHPNKTLGAFGDAGILVTDDSDIHAFLLRARNHGLGEGGCTFWSVNSRLDPLQAALLRVKLPHLDEWNARRRDIARLYREAIASTVTTPTEHPHEQPVYHTFIIRSDHREALSRHLARCGVETRIHYPVPLHAQPAAFRAPEAGVPPGGLPMTERLAREILSLPIFVTMTRGEIDHVIGAIREFRP